MTTFAVNENGATTRYSDYAFDSFCKGPDGRYYGIKSDGIYLLEGAVDSHVDCGDISFGTSAMKKLAGAYVAVASEADMLLHVTENGKTFDYPSRPRRDDIGVHRFDVGKGLRANYFGIALSNTDSATFTMDTVEVAAIPVSRRI